MKDYLAFFFVTGNVWLGVALVLILEDHYERSGPEEVSFFGLPGSWFDPGIYDFIVVLCVALAAACFFLTWKSRRPPAA